ncbi:MAG: hypothetical protein EKK37_17400 [Sphingobacteriales bacterium]|nr:MAG: hypothetical protein EKK37_17400 [Sphingobacteriales bacterium]
MLLICTPLTAKNILTNTAIYPFADRISTASWCDSVKSMLSKGNRPLSAHNYPSINYIVPATIPLNRNKMPPPSKKPSRLDIYLQDVMIISGCSAATASRKIKQVKDALGKKEVQRVTIKEYCDYYGYDYSDILIQLNLI